MSASRTHQWSLRQLFIGVTLIALFLGVGRWLAPLVERNVGLFLPGFILGYGGLPFAMMFALDGCRFMAPARRVAIGDRILLGVPLAAAAMIGPAFGAWGLLELAVFTGVAWVFPLLIYLLWRHDMLFHQQNRPLKQEARHG